MFRTFFIRVSTRKVIDEAGSMTSDIAKCGVVVSFEILDRINEIRPVDSNLDQAEYLKGDIMLRNVDVAYPQRHEVLVLQDLSPHIHPRQSVALVGQRGSRKSSIINLIERKCRSHHSESANRMGNMCDSISFDP